MFEPSTTFNGDLMGEEYLLLNVRQIFKGTFI